MKKTPANQIGAKAKRMQAQAERKKRNFASSYTSGGVQVTHEPQTIQILLIFFMCIAFAFVMTSTGDIDNFSRTITGNFTIDQIIIGPGTPVFIGDEMIDKIITSVIRGLIIFLFTAIVPFFAKFYSKITDNAKTNVFVLHWGVLVTVPFLIYLFAGFILPLVIEAIDLLTY